MITDTDKNTQLPYNKLCSFKSNLENKTLIYIYQKSFLIAVFYYSKTTPGLGSLLT